MSNITRGWNDERRRKQAKNCRKTKPWTKTTGPKTAQGKQAVRDNALTHGMRSVEVEELRRLLHLQQKIVTAMINNSRHPRGEA